MTPRPLQPKILGKCHWIKSESLCFQCRNAFDNNAKSLRASCVQCYSQHLKVELRQNIFWNFGYKVRKISQIWSTRISSHEVCVTRSKDTRFLWSVLHSERVTHTSCHQSRRHSVWNLFQSLVNYQGSGILILYFFFTIGQI